MPSPIKRPSSEPIDAGSAAKEPKTSEERASSSSPEPIPKSVRGSSPKPNLDASVSPVAHVDHSYSTSESGQVSCEPTTDENTLSVEQIIGHVDISRDGELETTVSIDDKGALNDDNQNIALSGNGVENGTHGFNESLGKEDEPVVPQGQPVDVQASASDENLNLDDSAQGEKLNDIAIELAQNDEIQESVSEEKASAEEPDEGLLQRQAMAIVLLKMKDLSHLLISEVVQHEPVGDPQEDTILDLTKEKSADTQPTATVSNMPLDLSSTNKDDQDSQEHGKEDSSQEVENNTKTGTENKPDNEKKTDCEQNNDGNAPEDEHEESSSDEKKQSESNGAEKKLDDDHEKDVKPKKVKVEKKTNTKKLSLSKKKLFPHPDDSDADDFERPNIPAPVIEDPDEDEPYLRLKVPPVELPDGLVIGEVSMSSDLKDLTTTELRKEVKRMRKNLNDTADDFIAAHRQCTRFRDRYAAMAIRHAELSQHIHIRETLKIAGTLNRKLTDEEQVKISGLKLRSGKKLKINRTKTMEEQEEESFNITAFSLMQDFKRNLQGQKGHKKGKLCIMQQYKERCAICCKWFQTKEGLESHLTAHTKSHYRCPLCFEINGAIRPFTSRKAFRFHLTWHKNGEPKFKCEICGVEKEWEKNLKSHMNTHQPPSKPCRVHPGCDAVFTFDQERKKHERTAFVKKIYRCELCNNKKFAEHIKLELHEARYHTPSSKHYIKPHDPNDPTPVADAQPAKSKKPRASKKPPASKKNNSAPSLRKTSTAKNRKTTSKSNPRNFAVDDPQLVVPLFANLSTDSVQTTSTGESRTNTSLDTSTSEYKPTNADIADAAREEENDDNMDLPDIF